jgi:RNA polymerase sigma-70 factor (family 1)
MFCRKSPDSEVYFTPHDYKMFTEIFNFFYGRLCFFANRLLKDPQAAEDLVADVFLKLWATQVSFKKSTSAKAWLYITTRNACFNYCKKVRHESSEKINANCFYSDETVLASITQAETLQEILNIINGLPTECYRIFKLSYFDNLTNDEIAKQLCLSIHTVKNQKARAIYLIRKRLRRFTNI